MRGLQHDSCRLGWGGKDTYFEWGRYHTKFEPHMSKNEGARGSKRRSFFEIFHNFGLLISSCNFALQI